MKDSLIYRYCYFVFFFIASYASYAQIGSNVYHSEQEKDGDLVHHELKIDGDYMTHTSYEKKPANFIKKLGGFYKIEAVILKVQLEFNSNFEKDSITQLQYKFENL